MCLGRRVFLSSGGGEYAALRHISEFAHTVYPDGYNSENRFDNRSLRLIDSRQLFRFTTMWWDLHAFVFPSLSPNRRKKMKYIVSIFGTVLLSCALLPVDVWAQATAQISGSVR